MDLSRFRGECDSGFLLRRRVDSLIESCKAPRRIVRCSNRMTHGSSGGPEMCYRALFEVVFVELRRFTWFLLNSEEANARLLPAS